MVVSSNHRVSCQPTLDIMRFANGAYLKSWSAHQESWFAAGPQVNQTTTHKHPLGLNPTHRHRVKQSATAFAHPAHAFVWYRRQQRHGTKQRSHIASVWFELGPDSAPTTQTPTYLTGQHMSATHQPHLPALPHTPAHQHLKGQLACSHPPRQQSSPAANDAHIQQQFLGCCSPTQKGTRQQVPSKLRVAHMGALAGSDCSLPYKPCVHTIKAGR